MRTTLLNMSADERRSWVRNGMNKANLKRESTLTTPRAFDLEADRRRSRLILSGSVTVSLLSLLLMSLLATRSFSWESLLDEIMCGAALLVALMFGSLSHGERVQRLIPLWALSAPVTLSFGFMIGGQTEPFSSAQLKWLSVTSGFCLFFGFMLAL